jgi:sugar lactone lactonase YvrE
MKAEQVTDAITHHGEGPMWDVAAERLRWVDMLRGDVLSMSLTDGRVERLHVGAVAATVRPRTNHGLVVAVERGFALVDASNEVTALPQLWDDTSIRMNDGACDPQGRFYCGSMAYDAATGRGAVYRLNLDGSVATVLTGATVSNGLAWRADGTTVLYVDSPTARIDELEFDGDTGTFTERRQFVAVKSAHGQPDGIALDVEGGVWVALWGGGRVHRYDADGRLDQVIRLPVRDVSACAFAPDGRLFITTSADGGDTDPRAGALFCVETGLTGLTIGAFAA